MDDCVLKLRLVSRKIKVALESNIDIKINIRIHEAGIEGLNADFLQLWHGNIHLYCKRPWVPDNGWFKEVKAGLEFGRL
jgi:hypothetical protein